MNKQIVILLSALMLGSSVSGCTSYFKRSATTVSDKEGKPIGTIFVWEADSNAALLDENGNVCMQNALAIKTTDSNISAKLSDALLELTKVSSRVVKDGSNPNKKNNLTEITGAIKQAATMLTTTTERTSFLNVGMFYICQIVVNKELSSAETQKLVSTLVTSAAGLDVGN